MMNFIESRAGRLAAGIQSFGGKFDPEVLALPGGTLIAFVLWSYASLKSCRTRNSSLT